MRTPVRKCTIQSKVSRDFSPDEKKAVIEMWEKEGTSLRQFAETHKMSRTTLRKWVIKKEEYDTSGRDCFGTGNGGRPPLLDETSKSNILQWIDDRVELQNCPNRMEIKQQMNKEIIDTFARRGIVRLDYSVDARTFNVYYEELKLSEYLGQPKTEARITAEADVRNVWSMYCMAEAFCKDMPSCMIFNWDATTFGMNKDD